MSFHHVSLHNSRSPAGMALRAGAPSLRWLSSIPLKNLMLCFSMSWALLLPTTIHHVSLHNCRSPAGLALSAGAPSLRWFSPNHFKRIDAVLFHVLPRLWRTNKHHHHNRVKLSRKKTMIKYQPILFLTPFTLNCFEGVEIYYHLCMCLEKFSTYSNSSNT